MIAVMAFNFSRQLRSNLLNVSDSILSETSGAKQKLFCPTNTVWISLTTRRDRLQKGDCTPWEESISQSVQHGVEISNLFAASKDSSGKFDRGVAARRRLKKGGRNS